MVYLGKYHGIGGKAEKKRIGKKYPFHQPIRRPQKTGF
jgi:hypothetical protein